MTELHTHHPTHIRVLVRPHTTEQHSLTSYVDLTVFASEVPDLALLRGAGIAVNAVVDIGAVVGWVVVGANYLWRAPLHANPVGLARLREGERERERED